MQSNSRLFATQQTTAHVRALLSFLHSSRLAFYPVFLWLWYNAFSGSIANKIQWWFWCVQYRLSFPGDLAQILYHNLQLQDLKSCIKRSDTVCPQVLTEACSWQTEWRICMLVFKKNVVAGGWNKIKQVWQVSVWEWQLLSSVGINLVSVGFFFAFKFCSPYSNSSAWSFLCNHRDWRNLKVSTTMCVCLCPVGSIPHIYLISTQSQFKRCLHLFIFSVTQGNMRTNADTTTIKRAANYIKKKNPETSTLLLFWCLPASIKYTCCKEKKSFSYCFLKLPQGSKQHKIAFPECWRKYRLYYQI